ncbi:MAG: hypothetical protein IJZ96_08715 [Lachnospiraceae bacterium]|nr:hypothetical protein [Lachnospiraceae bacterium]
MNSNIRNLKLEDLSIGMRVSIAELDSIIGVPIVLRDSSIDYSKPELIGEIVSIGEDGKENIVAGDSVYIYNMIDPEDFEWEF